MKREHFFPTVIMTIVLKQSRRCANLFLTDTIDFLKALWGIEDVIVVNQKCLILSQYHANCSPSILVLIKWKTSQLFSASSSR